MKEYTVEVIVEHHYRVHMKGEDAFKAGNKAIGYVMDNEKELNELYADARVAKYFLPNAHEWVEVE